MKRIKVLMVDKLPLDINEKVDDAVYHHSNMSMSINLKECLLDANKFDMDFCEYVARCINHEFLHYLLDIEQDYKTCHQLDNIAKQNIDYWMW